MKKVAYKEVHNMLLLCNLDSDCVLRLNSSTEKLKLNIYKYENKVLKISEKTEKITLIPQLHTASELVCVSCKLFVCNVPFLKEAIKCLHSESVDYEK